MAMKTEPRNGINYGWNLGESGWKDGMDANLIKIGHVGLHLSILDRHLDTPPGSPSDGDTYIPIATAVGDWVGEEGNIAIWNDDASVWVFYIPRIGYMAYIEDEEKLYIYKASGWVVVVTGGAAIPTMMIAVSDETTDLVTGINKITFRATQAMTLLEIRANCATAPTGSKIIVDINVNGSSILSTKLTIDAGEKTSVIADVAAVISDASIVDDDEITIDVDQIGSVIAGAGLKVTLIGG